MADTATDASGNYLFEGVQPGTLIVRCDLSSVTTDYRITAAHQGDDDALDSDGVSGDVGEFVYAMEMQVLAGTTNLNVDLGLVETLPAIKAAALDDLNTALAAYLLANYYTEGNWTALQTAKTDGDAAINAATDPAGVATAKNAALAAMDTVPTIAETLAEAKVAAMADLATARATYLEADYTPENWTAVNTDISRTSEGEVTLALRTNPSFLLTLETSTDFTSLSTIATATPDTELWSFLHDAALATGPRRFYRAFLNP